MLAKPDDRGAKRSGVERTGAPRERAARRRRRKRWRVTRAGSAADDVAENGLERARKKRICTCSLLLPSPPPPALSVVRPYFKTSLPRSWEGERKAAAGERERSVERGLEQISDWRVGEGEL